MTRRIAIRGVILVLGIALTGTVNAQNRLLSSGAAVTFSYPAISSPTLFAGNNGFRIVVPEGASRLEVRVQVPSSVQLAIGLRFGSDFPGTRFDVDHGGIVGENPVVVTTTSGPPLRTGTYYIGLAVLFSPGTISGSITATVSTAPASAPAIGTSGSLDFGSVAVGQSSEMTLTIRNTGTAALTVNTLSISTAQFRVVSTVTPFTVAAAGSQNVTLRFQPSSAGSHTAMLTIGSNDPARANVTVTLAGQAAAAATAAVAVSVTSLAFSANTGATPATQTFTVRNSGAGTLNYQITASQPWLSVSPSTGSSAGAANTVTAAVNTAGLGAGTHDGEIRVSAAGPGTTPLAVAVRLTLNELRIVSAASFAAGAALAPDSIGLVSAPELAAAAAVASPVPLPALPIPTTLGGVTVTIRDSTGTERPAAVFSVAVDEVRYLVPRETAAGPATLTVISRGRVTGAGPVAIETVAPGLFSADGSGRGAALGAALRIKSDGAQTVESIFRCTETGGSCETAAIDLGPEGDQVVLLLFATGIRAHSGLGAVAASIGADPAEVLSTVPLAQFSGVDQANVRLSRALTGRGEINVTLTVDGRVSNMVTIRVQ